MGGQGGKLTGDTVTYLGKKDVTELNGRKVTGADAWNEVFHMPFTSIKVNYTYYVTMNGTDVISHRIDYSTPGTPKVQHDLDSFRNVFKAPAECYKPNTLTCPDGKVQEWNTKYFSRGLRN